MYSSVIANSIDPRFNLCNSLLKHQVFCDGFCFGEVKSFERCFVDFGLTFFCEDFWFPAFFDEPFADLLTTSWVKGNGNVCERFAGLHSETLRYWTMTHPDAESETSA